mgnify:CR=1 FL=1
MSKVAQVLEEIKGMTVLEASELVKLIETTFGVSAAAPVMMGAVAGGGGAAAAPAEEKTSFDVLLESSGEKKVQVIKVVREINPALGLKEAKQLVDEAPKPVKEGATKEEAEKVKKSLEEAGAKVSIK